MKRIAEELRKIAEELEIEVGIETADANVAVCPSCGHQAPLCDFTPNLPAAGVGRGLGPGGGRGPGLGLHLGPGGGGGRRVVTL